MIAVSGTSMRSYTQRRMQTVCIVIHAACHVDSTCFALQRSILGGLCRLVPIRLDCLVVF